MSLAGSILQKVRKNDHKNMLAKKMTIKENIGRDYRIDQFRFIAFIGIFFIHFVSSWNLNHSTTLPYEIEIFSFIGRFAVPFFFITSGYFLKLNDTPASLIQHYAKRLLVPFVIWSVIYWAQYVAMNSPYNFSEMEHLHFYVNFIKTGGGGYQLWFLSALFLSISLVVIANRFFSNKTILLGSFFLFVAGLIITPYAPLIWGDNPPFHFGTRNGVFFGLVFVAIGIFLKEKLRQTTLRTGIFILIAGLIIQILEAVFLKIHCNSPMLWHDVLFGTLLIGVGSFVTALHMPFQSAFLASLGRVSLGFYVTHALFLKIFILLFPSNATIGALACFVLSFLSTTALVLLLGRWKPTHFLVS